MHVPTYLTFSLRLDAEEPIEHVKKNIESAMNIQMKSGSFAGVPAFVCEIFGIKLGLLLWRGIGGAPIFQFHGAPDPRQVRGDPWQEIRIDQAVIDLLRRRGAGEWREPSPEEQKASGDYDLDDI